MKSTGWIALLGIETKEAFAPIATLKRQIYLGALLISLLVALILRMVLKTGVGAARDGGGGDAAHERGPTATRADTGRA